MSIFAPEGLVVDRDVALTGDIVAAATFDPDRRYRYWLERRWAAGPTCVFLMLNPSTADAFVVDQTVNRCLSYARRERAGRLVVVNLFAWRSTYPKELLRCDDPVGLWNDAAIEVAADQADVLIVAWGAHGGLLGRDKAVLDRLAGRRLYRLGDATKGGHPPHPSRLAAAVPLMLHVS